MQWQRLSARARGDAPDVLVDGVPGYLRLPLTEWLRTEFGWHRTSAQGGVDQAFLQTLVLAVRLPVAATYAIGGISEQVTDAVNRNEELFLDVLDATMHLRGGRAQTTKLRTLLELGGSAWTVNADGDGLMRRVDPAASSAYADATAPRDSVADELDEAWRSAFGRSPNPSDAWDHAIKAVEELLIPIVVPKVAKPNLGGVAGQLHAASQKWQLVPTSSSTTLSDALTLEGMLRLIWPNPDRHGGGVARRAPTQAEAERVVHLAVAIVQLCRNGGLHEVPGSPL